MISQYLLLKQKIFYKSSDLSEFFLSTLTIVI